MCTSIPARHKCIMTRQHMQNFVSPTLKGTTVSHPYTTGDLLCYMTLIGDLFSSARIEIGGKKKKKTKPP